ncbi:hypothetical protein [Bradyrhizobium betae]|uniref:Uncharacterized protein n=1 Tax=Bradyrhizobium betae TaxID=244734 RepID=A0A5P6P476_9BRAD|nr:hypothetical protein [Bradyrhizobium betae]MCS3731221.1 ATP phosphoribosyltransferase regulatory subunit HisZ [Bradyrhizobium betae]QFI73179.1 hypothetical protein F8237_12700 [Bradyrhizobium betae]
MAKVTGFGELAKKMDELAKFTEELNGEIARVAFDPSDPSSIEAAIQELNNAIDAKAARYERNDWAANVAEQVKEWGRSKILERAAAARLEGDKQ